MSKLESFKKLRHLLLKLYATMTCLVLEAPTVLTCFGGLMAARISA